MKFAGAAGAGSQSRAAVGMLVNALATIPEPRVVIMLDDVHRLANPDIASLFESLIERLPESISVVLTWLPVGMYWLR